MFGNLKKTVRYTLFFILIALVSIILFGRQIDYGHSTQDYLSLMALYNYVLVFFELLGALAFFFLTCIMVHSFYTELSYYTSSFYAGLSLWFLLGLGILYFIPGILYLNNFVMFSHLFVSHWAEIQPVVSDITFSDFIVHLMDPKSNDENLKSQIPPMGGHTIAFGKLPDGSRYTCADIAKSIEDSFESKAARAGARLGKDALGIPDVACLYFSKLKMFEGKK